ncbi:hypothetical protein EGW08_013639 [Elysia chlorotica]|uniref:Uncharacterized protein n=1 Tax=Elysia chlorotica TaxID=188477 RepID=A0A3S1B8M3_ELYCH|nr:hypothetical protein EGW08_013639 [Elysia chlorotica]
MVESTLRLDSTQAWFTKVQDTCSRPYQLIFKNDHEGRPVQGSKTDLKNAVLRGAYIRVVTSGINGGAEQDFLVSGVNNINIRGSEVCASILDHVGQQMFEHRPSTSYYLQIYCTTGLFNFVNHHIDGNAIVNNGSGTATAAWFAWTPSSACLDHPATPTYSHFTDGGTHTGLQASLAAAVSGGRPVHLVRRDIGYLTGLDLVQVGWLAGLLVGWLVCWLVGWLVGWLDNWFVGCWKAVYLMRKDIGYFIGLNLVRVGWLAGLLVGWLVDWLVWLDNRFVGYGGQWREACPLGQERHRLHWAGLGAGGLVGWPVGWLVGLLVGLVGWLVGWIIGLLVTAVSGGRAVHLVRRDIGHWAGLGADGGNIVNGQSVWHTGQSYAPDHVVYNTDVPYRWLSSWSTSGRRHNQRWAYGGQEEILHNVDYASLDWFVDPCWRRVYSHSESGARLKGTIGDLITAIDQGHRVRVKVGAKVMEARALRVSSGYVHAQLIDQIAEKGGVGEDKLDLADDAYWVWSFVDTNGGVYREHYFYGNNTEAAPAAVTTSIVDWFVDTRPWARLLEVAPTGTGKVEKAIYSYALENSFVSKMTTDNDLVFYTDDYVPLSP